MKHLIIFSALIMGVFSCSEDKVIPPNNTQILTSGSWIKTAVTFDKIVNIDVSGVDIEKAYIDSVDACLLDESFSFLENFDLIIDNPETCEDFETSTFNCNWIKINSNTFALDEHCGGYTSPYTILRIADENTMYLTMEQIFYQYPLDTVFLEYEWKLTKE